MRGEVYLGLDISLTGLGMVAIPADWDGDFEKLDRNSLGIELDKNATPRQQIDRMLALALDVRIWAARKEVTIVCYEDSLPRDAYSVKPLAKLLGYIEKELAQGCGLFAEPVNQSSARKFFLGYLPTKRKGGPRVDRKKVITSALDGITDIFQWHDEKDAFVCANYRMGQDPGVHVIQLNAPNPNVLIKPMKKPRAKRAA